MIKTVKGTKTKLKKRHVTLAPMYEDSCPMHGPWQIQFKALFTDPVEVSSGAIDETVTKVGGKYLRTIDLKLTNEAMRALVFMYMSRQSIKDVDALWDALLKSREDTAKVLVEAQEED